MTTEQTIKLSRISNQLLADLGQLHWVGRHAADESQAHQLVMDAMESAAYVLNDNGPTAADCSPFPVSHRSCDCNIYETCGTCMPPNGGGM